MLTAVPVLAALLAQPFALGIRDLPVPRTERLLRFASRDPSGGNIDRGHFVARLPDDRLVLAECDGPGRVARIWSANPTGTLCIELDDRIAYEGAFADLLAGAVEGFPPPLAGRGTGGGLVFRHPLPFREHCRITCRPDDPPALYWQVDVACGADSADATAEELLAGPFPRDACRVHTAHWDGRGARELVAVDGPGEVVELRIRGRAAGPDPFAERDARRTWLEIRCDKETEPSIAGPLGDLTGVAFDGDGVECQPLHSLGRTRVFRLPMPFHSRLSIRAVPVAEHGVPFALEVAVRALPEGRRRLPLRGRFVRTTNVRGRPFTALEVHGSGHFVGGFWALAGGPGHGLTFLEGDETLTVDGRDVIAGTGTEDYFNGAWYFRGGTFGHLFHALATLDERRGRVAVARFHVDAPVPFTESLRFDLEHGGRDDAPGSDYAAMLFWYGAGPLPPAAPPAERERCARLMGAPAPLDFAARELFSEHVRDGRVLLPPTVRTAALRGPALDLARLRRADVLRVVLRDAEGVDHTGFANLGASERIALPERHRTIEATALRLEPWLAAIRTWRIAGPFVPATPERGIDEPFDPERDPDPDREYPVAGTGPRGWRELAGPGHWTGYVDLDPHFVPNDGVVAYAATIVHSDREQPAELVLGSDDAVVVWLDGREIHRKRVLRGSGRDQDRVPVTLRRGDQLLLFKVEDYRGGFGFHARLDGAEGLTFRIR